MNATHPPSRESVRIAALLARTVRPLADALPASGAALRLTRRGVDVLGRTRRPAGAATWPARYGDVPGRWFRDRAASRSTGIVVHAHGGGFVWGSSTSHRALSSWLSHHTGMPVLVPDYRRAPESPVPAARDDVLTVYRALLGRGIDPARIVITSDSAGGHIAASVLSALRGSDLRLPAALTVAHVYNELQVWPGQVHVFQSFGRFLPEAAEALRCVGAFARAAVERAG